MLAALLQQQRWCMPHSPFTARLMALSISWLECADTPASAQALQALSALSEDPLEAAVPLRWAAALHRLALTGLQPWAGLWPSTPSPNTRAASGARFHAAFEQAWLAHQPLLCQMLASAPQTNEVARSAMLLPGLLMLQARWPEHRLRLFEIGSSAGLNLLPDAWHYDYGQWVWGSTRASLTLRSEWQGEPPAAALVQGALRIEHRAGCDLNPLSVATATGVDATAADDAAAHLRSFVWPDQTDRLARLDAAIAFRRSADCPAVDLQRTSAATFVQRELAEPALAGTLRVLVHSIVWQYLALDERREVQRQVEAAGRLSTADTPLAWLRMEPPSPEAPVELRLSLWPEGSDQCLALCHAHGQWIRWSP